MKRDVGKLIQLGFSGLLLVCIAQAVYWIGDSVYYTNEVTRQFELMTRSEAGSVDDIRTLDEVRAQSEARINRYIWEGAFFLVVLTIGLVLIWRAIREDFELRKRQQNFISAVSHELRSPVSSIRLATDLLLKDNPKDSVARHGERIRHDTDRLIRLIDNLLSVSRIEDVRWSLSPQYVSLKALTESLFVQLDSRMKALKVVATVDIDDSAVVWMDATALEMVLRNLLDNALNACSLVEERGLWVSTTLQADGLLLSIRDSGSGFEPVESERIFEKFYRVGDELRRRTPGTGLGLYLVKRLCELSDVAVSARSAGSGQGAEFILVFPKRGLA